jgi:hypothetical protein
VHRRGMAGRIVKTGQLDTARRVASVLGIDPSPR